MADTIASDLPRTFVLGDVHGAYRALQQVLERANFDYERDCLISLGDVADGWHEVPECVEELLKVRHLIAICGNHDYWFREFLKSGHADRAWLNQGGEATLAAYERTGLLTDARHRAFFLQGQRDLYIDGQHRLFVHGGIEPEYRIEDQPPAHFYWNRSMWRQAIATEEFQGPPPEDVNGFSEIFVGHTNTLREYPDLKPVRCWKVWNLDQGVRHGGKLTLMNVADKTFYQSDRAALLYAS